MILASHPAEEAANMKVSEIHAARQPKHSEDVVCCKQKNTTHLAQTELKKSHTDQKKTQVIRSST